MLEDTEPFYCSLPASRGALGSRLNDRCSLQERDVGKHLFILSPSTHPSAVSHQVLGVRPLPITRRCRPLPHTDLKAKCRCVLSVLQITCGHPPPVLPSRGSKSGGKAQGASCGGRENNQRLHPEGRKEKTSWVASCLETLLVTHSTCRMEKAPSPWRCSPASSWEKPEGTYISQGTDPANTPRWSPGQAAGLGDCVYGAGGYLGTVPGLLGFLSRNSQVMSTVRTQRINRSDRHFSLLNWEVFLRY